MAWRTWLVLGSSVLAAHWWLLSAVVTPLEVSHRPPVAVFTMRHVDAGPDKAAPVPSSATVPVQAKVRVAVPRPRNLQPVALEVPSAEPLPDQPAVIGAVPSVPRDPAQGAPAPATPIQSFSIPGPVRLHYQVVAAVRQIRLQGEGELAWHHDGTHYDARLELRSPLLPRRIQHSQGLITAEGLAPERFSDKVRSEEAAHFQREQGKVSFSSNRPDAPLLPGTQDRLSVMLQLGAMVAAAPARFPVGTAISIPTASTREAEPWQFTVEASEELELPGGRLPTLKLIRNPRREFDQKVELWLATGMDYVPVRLRLTQANGDWVDQQWSSTDRR